MKPPLVKPHIHILEKETGEPKRLPRITLILCRLLADYGTAAAVSFKQ